jgi:toxin ParE1/3/4
VPRLVYRAAAQRDIAEIAAYIERESQDRGVAEAFIEKLTAYCERLARLPGLLGRPRPELGRDYRSTTFGNYVIFFRYADEGSPRSHYMSFTSCTAHAISTRTSIGFARMTIRRTDLRPSQRKRAVCRAMG